MDQAHYLWWIVGCMHTLAASCSIFVSMTGPPPDQRALESFIGVPKDRSKRKRLNPMGRRNRSRSHFSSKVYVPSRDKLLKQDFAVLGVAWPFEIEPGQTNAVQGSTLNSNAMDTNASRS